MYKRKQICSVFADIDGIFIPGSVKDDLCDKKITILDGEDAVETGKGKMNIVNILTKCWSKIRTQHEAASSNNIELRSEIAVLFSFYNKENYGYGDCHCLGSDY